MLQVENLQKRFQSSAGSPAGGVFGVSFQVAEGELFTLLGPSGCGKTTTLRSIAGLELPDSGRIRLGGNDIYNSETGVSVSLHRRNIGMVFQSYAIWPHMDVFENAAYPLRARRRQRPSRQEIAAKVEKVLDMVGLRDYIRRPATQLSGGQQQRLAFARALTREPGLLLLDEPLSNLDAQLREQMRTELVRLQRDTGLAAIYVTHDQSEALAISDRIAVMSEGRIVQTGSPQEIYDRPDSEFVANFIGRSNLIRGDLTAAAAGQAFACVKTEIGDLECWFKQATPPRPGVVLVVRPENIELAPRNGAAANGTNRSQGVILRKVFLGEINEYAVGIGSQEVIVRKPGAPLAVGDSVSLHIPPDKTIALA
jgi:iron(III) transport system ATP-binding protein